MWGVRVRKVPVSNPRTCSHATPQPPPCASCATPTNDAKDCHCSVWLWYKAPCAARWGKTTARTYEPSRFGRAMPVLGGPCPVSTGEIITCLGPDNSLRVSSGSVAGRLSPLHEQPCPSHCQRKHQTPQEHLFRQQGLNCRQLGPCAPAALLRGRLLLRRMPEDSSQTCSQGLTAYSLPLPCTAGFRVGGTVGSACKGHGGGGDGKKRLNSKQ